MIKGPVKAHAFQSIAAFLLTAISAGCGETAFVGAPKDLTAPESLDVRSGDPLKIQRQFTVGEKRQFQSRIMLQEKSGQLRLPMELLPRRESRFASQVRRPLRIEQVKQGTPATRIEELFEQSESGVLDILIVVDNSSSMDAEQKKLSKKMSPLLSAISETNWTIGVTTTDPDDQCLRELIKKGEADVEKRFKEAIEVGIEGTGNERGLLMARRMLESNCLQQAWPRANSSLAVLFITDEDNCSDGEDCKGEPDAESAYLKDYLNQIRTFGVDAKVHGIFWHPNTGALACLSAQNKAHTYSALVAESGGVWGSICANDYGDTLEAISNRIADTLKSQFILQQIPNEQSVEVSVNGVAVAVGYSIKDSTLTFDAPPDSMAQIKVSYDTGESSMFDSVTLPGGAHLIKSVLMNGQNMAPENYQLGIDGKTVFFNPEPEVMAEVKIAYVQAIELPRRFAVGPFEPSAKVELSVAGVPQSDFEFNALEGWVELNSAPEEGALVTVVLDSLIEPKLEYAFALPVDTVTDMKASSSIGGHDIAKELEIDRVVIGELAFQAGAEIILDYQYISPDQLGYLAFQASPGVIAQSFVAESRGKTCSIENGVVLNDDSIDLRGCGFDGITDVVIAYDYLEAGAGPFEVPDADNLIPSHDQLWKVYVNKAVVEFEREGLAVRPLVELVSGDVVVVEVSSQ